jgi:hypothetical protein
VKLNDYLLIFVGVGLIGVLLIASPAIASLVHLPSGEEYSELYLLGPQQMADNYPFDIAANQNYSVYLNVENHVGSAVYYVLYVKFGNLTDPLPNSLLGTPSSLSPLYEYAFSLPDGGGWESLVTFSVSNASISGDYSQINTLHINGLTFNVDKPSLWDTNSTTFRYQLLFELWVFSSKSDVISYDDRFVDLQLNLTSTI